MLNKITKKYLFYRAGKLDANAFAEVYDLRAEKIYRFVYFKVSSTQDAQDITSEVFLKTWEYLQKAETKIENLEALLYKVARNLVIDFYRKRKEIYDATDEGIEMLSQKEAERKAKEFHERLDVKIQTQEVCEALEELNDLYREVITLKYIDQLSTNEIASIINKSWGATRVLIHRALAVLKKILEKRFENK